MKAVLHTDGGARGNPGPAAIGYVLAVGGRPVVEGSQYIGKATNNRAEYVALIKGLRRALEEGAEEVACYLDSELLVEQLNGRYKVKDAGLKPLFVEVRNLSERFSRVSFTHVPREKNKRADKLVNKALNTNTPPK